MTKLALFFDLENELSSMSFHITHFCGAIQVFISKCVIILTAKHIRSFRVCARCCVICCKVQL